MSHCSIKIECKFHNTMQMQIIFCSDGTTRRLVNFANFNYLFNFLIQTRNIFFQITQSFRGNFHLKKKKKTIKSQKMMLKNDLYVIILFNFELFEVSLCLENAY